MHQSSAERQRKLVAAGRAPGLVPWLDQDSLNREPAAYPSKTLFRSGNFALLGVRFGTAWSATGGGASGLIVFTTAAIAAEGERHLVEWGRMAAPALARPAAARVR